jgi:hypothetical protein
MKKLIIVFMFMLAGCANMPVLPSVCDNAPVDSIVCQKLSEINIQIEDIDILMQVVLTRAVKESDKTIVKNYIETAIRALETDTFSILLSSWDGITEGLTAPEVTLLRRYLGVFDVDILVGEFDKKLITDLLNHQLEIL